jgi:hypothetical protein
VKLGAQLIEQPIGAAHALEHRIRREPQIRIERIGALQPRIALSRIHVLLVNARLEL